MLDKLYKGVKHAAVAALDAEHAAWGSVGALY